MRAVPLQLQSVPQGPDRCQLLRKFMRKISPDEFHVISWKQTPERRKKAWQAQERIFLLGVRESYVLKSRSYKKYMSRGRDTSECGRRNAGKEERLVNAGKWGGTG